jgi:hypothetical protein
MFGLELGILMVRWKMHYIPVFQATHSRNRWVVISGAIHIAGLAAGAHAAPDGCSLWLHWVGLFMGLQLWFLVVIARVLHLHWRRTCIRTTVLTLVASTSMTLLVAIALAADSTPDDSDTDGYAGGRTIFQWRLGASSSWGAMHGSACERYPGASRIMTALWQMLMSLMLCGGVYSLWRSSRESDEQVHVLLLATFGFIVFMTTGAATAAVPDSELWPYFTIALITFHLLVSLRLRAPLIVRAIQNDPNDVQSLIHTSNGHHMDYPNLHLLSEDPPALRRFCALVNTLSPGYGAQLVSLLQTTDTLLGNYFAGVDVSSAMDKDVVRTYFVNATTDFPISFSCDENTSLIVLRFRILCEIELIWGKYYFGPRSKFQRFLCPCIFTGATPDMDAIELRQTANQWDGGLDDGNSDLGWELDAGAVSLEVSSESDVNPDANLTPDEMEDRTTANVLSAAASTGLRRSNSDDVIYVPFERFKND